MTQALTNETDRAGASSQIAVNRNPTTESDLLRVSQSLPLIFVNLLERRYINDFAPERWHIEPGLNDNGIPLLREVKSLGNPRHKEEWSVAMPHVLAACHEPGNGLAMTVYGDGQQHHIYLGARRLVGQGGRSTEDFLKSQESAFRAFFGGLSLGDQPRALDGEEMPQLTEFLQWAPALAAVTGIPSRRKVTPGLPFELQSIDQLVKAIGDQRYALMVVAEPIRPEDIEVTLDVCRRLIGFVHAFTAVTKTQGTTQASSTTALDPSGADLERTNWPTMVRLLTGIVQSSVAFAGKAALAGPINPFILFAGVSTIVGALDTLQSRADRQQERTKSTSEGSSDQISASFLDANAEACERLLRDYVQRLDKARSTGWWRTAVYIAAENDAVLASVGGALRSLCSGETTYLDPIRILTLPGHVLRDAIIRGQVLALRPSDGEQGHPFGESFDALGTCLTSEELAVLVNLPRTEIPGIPMRDLSEFCLSGEPAETRNSGDKVAGNRVQIGVLKDSLGRSLSSVTISEQTLNRHIFVTGITGSGKTNTCWQLLWQAYKELDVPFLVIEPAKAEYHRLAQIPELRGKLRVYSVGGLSGAPLRLNPFNWVEGIPLLRHINLLKAVFTASLFPPGQDSPLPYLMEDALWEVYLERGWDLHTSANPYLTGSNSLHDRSALLPSLDDFASKLREVVNRRGYDEKIRSNLQAYSATRLRSISSGIKGSVLNTKRSTRLESLFESPTVIELKDVGDEDEKAFLMALLFTLLCEYAEVRVTANEREQLQHITLIEEAHRLLKATGGGHGREIADPGFKAVTMFTDMLAEMRAYGEGFIIVDQIPTKLAPETLKNTNLKIVHRLAASDDRRAVGECINLSESQMRHLNNLTPGMSVTHFEAVGEPILCYVPDVKDTLAPVVSDSARSALVTTQDKLERMFLYRHAGCECCSSPCNYFHEIDTAVQSQAFLKPLTSPSLSAGLKISSGQSVGESDGVIIALGRALMPVFTNVIANRPKEAFNALSSWCRGAKHSIRAIADSEGKINVPIAYCAVAQAAHHQLGELARDRSMAVRGIRSILAADLVGREAAAAAMAPLFSEWLAQAAFDEKTGAESFNKSRTGLISAMFREPPEEFGSNPYCPKCPRRCVMLPFVGGIGRALADMIPNVVRKQTEAGRQLQLREEIEKVRKTISPISSRSVKAIDPEFHVWEYCVLANLAFLSDSGYKELEALGDEHFLRFLEGELMSSGRSAE
jgi:Helicase HerA, central domain